MSFKVWVMPSFTVRTTSGVETHLFLLVGVVHLCYPHFFTWKELLYLERNWY